MTKRGNYAWFSPLEAEQPWQGYHHFNSLHIMPKQHRRRKAEASKVLFLGLRMVPDVGYGRIRRLLAV
jgi:hypothetical protein